MGLCFKLQEKRDAKEAAKWKCIIENVERKPMISNDIDPESWKELPWVEAANEELGQAEIVGKKHNPRVIEYHQSTSLKAQTDEIAWCAAFINWVLIECGITGTTSAAAQSFLKWGDKLEEPKLGCICVLKRGSKAWMGHVGIVVKFDDDYVWLLGGNQSNMVCVRKYSRSKELGYRWPQWQGLQAEPQGL